MSKWLASNWFSLTQTIILTAGLIFAGVQLHEQTVSLQQTEKVNSANFVLAISNEQSNSRYNAITTAIEGPGGQFAASTSPLFARGFTQSDIEDYLGGFETVGDLMHDGLVQPSMVDDELGYDLEKAWCNHDVQAVIQKDRAEDQAPPGVPLFYDGFELAAKTSLQLDHKTCSGMDKE